MFKKYKIPLIRLHEGGGGSVTGSGGSAKKPTIPNSEPVFSKNRFQSLAQCLGIVPVVTAALGPVAGLPAARLVASHFSVMTKNAQVLIAGPAVVKRALGIETTKEELGGYEVHLNFSPVIVYKNWLEDYKFLFQMCNDYIDYKDEVKCEVMFLTHNKQKHY